ncbi:uncharacterized protein LOC114240372 [Bombyx mandarina]|uniref:Uncharacterized protein LOC114240372 n=1 Tax=Bombyx mandarina TaxID=7092 RepID=A0A6J2JB16_BOMMA|nr:uncharacterized protein LOC114240372 [Bombyx mandarina]
MEANLFIQCGKGTISLYPSNPATRLMRPHRPSIDYILSNRSTAFQDCRVINNLNFNSNHRPVRAKLKLNTSKKSPFKANLTNKTTSQNINGLKEKLINFIENTKDLHIQDTYNKLQEIINEKAPGKASDTRKNKISWLSDKTKQLLEDRANLFSTSNKTKDIRKKITVISKQININMRKERQKFRLEKLEKCIQKTGGVRKALKELSGKRDWIPNMKDRNDRNTTRRPEIITRATDFFKKLYSSQITTPKIDLSGQECIQQ